MGGGVGSGSGGGGGGGDFTGRVGAQRAVRLGGRSKLEETREEVLAQAARERAARSEARQRARAATTLAAGWRGAAARRALRGALLREWHAAYAAAAAQPDALLPARELRGGAVRLLLATQLPPGSSATARALAAGDPLRPAPPDSSVRGTLALLLRSLAQTDPALNYARAWPAELSWRLQAAQVCQLCCLALAADAARPPADAVLDAAAARTLQLLTGGGGVSSSSSRSSSGGARVSSADGGGAPPLQAGQGGGEVVVVEEGLAAAAAAVRAQLRAQPMPLLRAARRLVDRARAINRSDQAAAAQSIASKGGGAAAAAAAGALSPAAAATASLQRVVDVAVMLLSDAMADQPPPQQQQQQQLAEQLVLVVLSAPQLTAVLPAANKARLLQPRVIVAQLLPTAQRLADSGRLCGASALHCLANLAQLLIGRGPGVQQQQQQQPQPQPLTDGATALAYVRAASALLAAGTQRPRGGSNGRRTAEAAAPGPEAAAGGEDAASALAGCAALGSQAHLLQLLDVLTAHCGADAGTALWAGYCAHLLVDGAAASAAAATGCGGGGGGGADAAAPSPGTGSSSSSRGDLSTSALNALAFSPTLLPRLWRWLAVAGGLPLEVPLQATRGLDVAATRGGPDGLPPHVALVLGVLCRALSQLLLVLDDSDLHERQVPFTLGASRAVVCALNSLVFHGFFPAAAAAAAASSSSPSSPSPPPPAAAAVPAAAAGHGRELLRRHAPAVLRGYHERDARAPFCQAALWTSPYEEMVAGLQARQRQQQQQQQQQGGGGGVVATTAAVVQALLASSGLVSDDGGGGAADQPPVAAHARAAAMAAAAAGPGVPGLRTGSLLALLRAAPQCVPFAVRLELFRQLLAADKARGRYDLAPAEGGVRPLRLTVRRGYVLEDAYAQLARAGAGVKARLSVAFVNEQGLQEAGLDHGGLTKELLEGVVAAGTRAELGLFAATEGSGGQLVYPNPAAAALPQGLPLLEFVGLAVGRALYEGILLELPLAPFFVRSLQGGRPGLDDLAGLDSTLHQNLLRVKRAEPAVVDAFGLTFSAEQDVFGKTVAYDLIPNGADVAVTADNRLLYAHLLADWHLNARLGRAAAAFAAGLTAVLPRAWLRLFSPKELNQLISGGDGSEGGGGIAVDDMRAHARYGNGYSESSGTVRLFWRVVAELTPEQRGKLLAFVTSCSRPPLGGFRFLQPPLTIAKVDCGASPLALLGGRDVERLPTASTCFNTLKLPNYRTKRALKERLLYAIGAGAGFELS